MLVVRSGDVAARVWAASVVGKHWIVVGIAGGVGMATMLGQAGVTRLPALQWAALPGRLAVGPQEAPMGAAHFGRRARFSSVAFLRT